MTSIKEKALAHEQSKTRNISELEKFSANMDLETFEGFDSEGKKYSYEYITDKDGAKYRVPNSVLAQMHVYLIEDPSTEFFKVKKSGEGLKTSYTVMPVKA